MADNKIFESIDDYTTADIHYDAQHSAQYLSCKYHTNNCISGKYVTKYWKYDPFTLQNIAVISCFESYFNQSLANNHSSDKITEIKNF